MGKALALDPQESLLHYTVLPFNSKIMRPMERELVSVLHIATFIACQTVALCASIGLLEVLEKQSNTCRSSAQR